ncbi:pantothenate transporter, partial [Apiospora marii]
LSRPPYGRHPESLRGMTEGDLKKLERKMVRKVDFVILPIMTILYILNSQYSSTVENGLLTSLAVVVDRSALAASKVYGITDDLNMSEQDFATAISILFGELRLFALSYTRELILTFANFRPTSRLHPIPDPFEPHHHQGFSSRSIEGVVTVGCGILFALITPEYPHNARLLSPVERDYAVWRLEKEAGAGEAHEDTTTRQGFFMALRDPKIWALVWCMAMSQAIGSSGNFFPSIVQTLGYGKNQTLLLTAPPYLLAVLVIVGASWASDVSTHFKARYNSIYSMIVGSLCIGVVAYVIPLATLSTGGRYFAMMLMPTAIITEALPQIMMYKTLNLHMARPYPKRSAGTAMINSLGGLSNLWASYLWYAPPHYYGAFGCCKLPIFTPYGQSLFFPPTRPAGNTSSKMKPTSPLINSFRLLTPPTSSAGLRGRPLSHHYRLPLACAQVEQAPGRDARGAEQGHEERCDAAADRSGLAIHRVLGSTAR